MRRLRIRGRAMLVLAALSALVMLVLGQAAPLGAAGETINATYWNVRKFPQPQPACTGAFLNAQAVYFDRLDCGVGRVRLSNTGSTSGVKVEFVAENGGVVGESVASYVAASQYWEYAIRPATTWPTGEITMRAKVDDAPAVGAGQIFFQQLGASVAAVTRPEGYRPGDAVPVAGRIYEQKSVGLDTVKTDVAATYSLQVVTSDGQVRGPYGPFTANKGGAGQIQETLPASATQGLTATQDTNYDVTIGVEVVNASYTDLATGAWTASREGAGHVTLSVPPGRLILDNSFISAVGWVKPGDTYPFRVFIKNFDSVERTGAVVTIPSPDGTTLVRATPTTGSGTASISGGTITWKAGSIPARTASGPGMRTLVVEGRADRLSEDPQIVWKDISTTATLTYTGGTTITDRSKGPKVIPPKSTFDTARYGYRPFPVVPVDYSDRKHEASHSSERLLSVINSPQLPGSTYNLYQEMSYGQLHPHGTVPSAAVASADFNVAWSSPHRKARGFSFSRPLPAGVCYGATVGDVAGTPLYNERIRNGWYQLPGDTAYYGGDKDSFANVAVPQVAFIDNACGSIAKAVYDSALIADPEIDYSDFDTDKDGVVDFYMMVFVGKGGNGASQLSVPPYDNIWPHSSSLEQYFKDPDTGQPGYVSDDQLKDNEGRLLYYTDSSRGAMTTTPTSYPVYVRVGPYNVNPESAIEKASVISHEYGHSLGLPDYYSSGTARATYGDWNLMATDKSQNMDVNGKQELGWLIPRVLKPGETNVSGWRESKINTHRIDWTTPSGTPYTLSGANVNNGEAYVAKLPGKQILDAKQLGTSASPTHIWWSRSGNDFNCSPIAGHNLDINLPELATVPAGTPVTLTFKSYWDIEWDYDYGFVLTSTDNGQTYISQASKKGFSTPKEFNPNGNACQEAYGNGLTGTTRSYVDSPPTFAVDRNPAESAYPQFETNVFTDDEYDLSSLAGKAAVLRFSYATDPGLARPGWFIDDVKVTAGDRVIYQSDFESGPDEVPIYNGGCKEGLGVATKCTAGWQYISVTDLADQDHAYYLEMRDRSGFDFNGKDQIDRSPLGWSPGLLLVYTNEAEGYGNTGESGNDSPNQSPLDSSPQPGNQTPNLDDAAFTAASGKNAFSDSTTAANPGGWVDNYHDAGDNDAYSEAGDDNWHFDFNCLTFQVLAMSGDDVGPNSVPGNLTGDVKVTTGSGCGPYNYGVGPETNGKPTAVAQAKPTGAEVNQKVRFDGSASYDDRESSAQLTYAWDFDGNGTWDASGRQAVSRYTAPGSYAATLRVTDSGGLSDTDTITITVR